MFCKYKKIALSLLLLVSAMLSADGNSLSLTERILGAIGQSSMMHYYSKNVQSKIDKATRYAILDYGDQPASQEYQELGKQAQFAVGIPENRHVPVKKINLQSPIASLVSAVAEADVIYVNEDKLNKGNYGSRRSALFHEAVHVKYHDKAMEEICALGGLFGTTLATYAGLKKLKIASWNKSISFAAGICIASYLGTKYSHFREKRADIEGHLATQCVDCITKHAEKRKQLFEVENHALKDAGYLCSTELEKIAKELGNKKCQYHAGK